MTIGAGRLAAFLLATAAAALPARAQDAPAPSPAGAARVYAPEDFARFAPRNALDMLRQVPGFVIREASQERGLGQATGNVLLNGQRISGKTDDILTQLNRVPAQNVVRIEIVDGATLDVPGLTGQVANVIVRASTISGQFAWRPEFRAHFTDPLLTRFEASVSGERGPVEFTLGLENQSSHGGAGGETLIYDAGGALVDRRFDIWTSEFEQPRVSGRFAIDGPGSSVGNLNLVYRRFWYDFVEDGARRGIGQPDRERAVRIDEDGYNYEMGGDFELALGPGRLKLVGLNRYYRSDVETFVQTGFADGRPDVGDRFMRRAEETERIARAEYRWRSGATDWQISGEGAFNGLDIASRLFVLDPGGEFDEIPLPNGTARVSEDRFEGIVSWGRALAPNLTLQINAGGEYSRLSQTGAAGLTRSFFRPKGQINAAWKPGPRTDVNLRLQRRVAQLSFYDFIATVNLQDDRQNAGNPDLVPPQVWDAQVEVAHNLGAWGNISVRPYFHLIDDIVDIVPIGATGESPGNIDRAVRYGVEWKSTFNFDPIGWRGAKLDTRLQFQRSRLDDPLTGEPREISNALLRLVEMSLRHDIPGSDWAWGGSANYVFSALNTRLTEVGRQWEGPVWANVYIEHKDVMGLTLRATAGNLLGADSMWDRTVFAGRRTGPIAFTEIRDRRIGPIFSFQVRGRF